jgi:hypothetical protein
MRLAQQLHVPGKAGIEFIPALHAQIEWSREPRLVNPLTAPWHQRGSTCLERTGALTPFREKLWNLTRWIYPMQLATFSWLAERPADGGLKQKQVTQKVEIHLEPVFDPSLFDTRPTW